VDGGRPIPYVNIAAQHASIRGELLEAVGRVIDHGRFILGDEVEQFEQAFAARCGVRYAVAVNSGTDALILALRALGIGEGDEVVTPPNSFIASASAIRLAGARPVFADVGTDYNISPDAIRAAITPRTRAILPVHLTGRPCDMAAIMDIARAHELHVVEDCAQAVFAKYDDHAVGSFGSVGCFSLHPLKTLNACGDGGVLTTNDAQLSDRFRVLRNIGLRSRKDCVTWSGNSRLDTIQAALLLVKLRYVDAWTTRRRENAAHYQAKFSGVDGVIAPADGPLEYAVYHTFVVQAQQRDELRAFLTGRGIGTQIHYPTPIHLSTAARELGYATGSFPVTESQAKTIVSLPVYPELTRDDLDRVSDAVIEFCRSRSVVGAA
jgi:dTDP-4-amino-4,6-dideoxygalactose transaminase